MKKDEIPHEIPIDSVIDEIFVNAGMRLIAIHKEITIWEWNGAYRMYSFANFEAFCDSYKEIMKKFNDYFNKSNGK